MMATVKLVMTNFIWIKYRLTSILLAIFNGCSAILCLPYLLVEENPESYNKLTGEM